ncbi:uncharacterized protein LOC111599246 [Drosophila hydei]|uniref:Uncharacterized protein LOC111599246 n=1 Tax=Drosophila hydei TaxID=7224 RepID=A0A6J1LY15_DROHY|nr:uncharacterized protein LOC111599246 [Drosophila hydei]
MDNFNVPKRINRNVMKALGVLQGTHSMTAFVPAQSIIKQVELQMRRSKNMPNIEEYVLKSLCSLTHLGVLVRTGYSDYALRQALVFEDGTSAIPWRSSNTPVESSSTKLGGVKASLRKRATKSRMVRSRPKARRATIRNVAQQSIITPKPCRICVKRKPSVEQPMESEPAANEVSALVEIPSGSIIDFNSNSFSLDTRWSFNYPIPISASGSC